MTEAEAPQVVQNYWRNEQEKSDALLNGAQFQVYRQHDLEDKLVKLTKSNGCVDYYFDSDISAKLDNKLAAGISVAEDVDAEISSAGLSYHGADYLFYFKAKEKALLTQDADVRALSSEDQVVFNEFQDTCPEDELDEAYVELEHWMVRGLFIDNKLVAIASAYPDGDEMIADMGVITIPDERSKGYGARLIRAISADILAMGYEPQYRCQLDNTFSIKLAASCGLSLFATWDVLSPED